MFDKTESSTADRIAGLLTKFPVGLLGLLFAMSPVVAAGGGEERDLMSLGLEELMDIQLDAMAISDIHHTHDKNEWMVGYSFKFMSMNGNRDGTERLSDSDVLGNFMVAPSKMDMQMHMFGLMYAPSDKWTLMFMAPYTQLSMEHLTQLGTRFTTSSRGLGDVSVSGLYNLYHGGGRRFILNAGISLPTGSIDETDETPMGNVTLPYPMQLGSGTYDALPGMTYLEQQEKWMWGARASGKVRLGQNSRDYRLGNRLDLTAWVAREITRWMSLSAQVERFAWDDIHGSDPDLNPAMAPTADPELRGGERTDFVVGMNLYALEGRLEGQRITLQARMPLHQNLDGPQLETDIRLVASWQWTFVPKTRDLR